MNLNRCNSPLLCSDSGINLPCFIAAGHSLRENRISGAGGCVGCGGAGHHLPPLQGAEGTSAVRDRAGGQPVLGGSPDGSHGGSSQCGGSWGMAPAPAAG